MPTLPSQDIEFQPKTSEYSFTTQKPKSPLNTFFTLVLAILGLLLLFFIFLGVLNYFNVISLSSFSPALTQKLSKTISLPPPIFDPQNKTYSINGILYGYNNDIIKVRYYYQIISFKFIPGQSSFNTKKVGLQSSDTLADLDNEKNIGKKVKVIYSIENKVNVIQEISLTN